MSHAPKPLSERYMKSVRETADLALERVRLRQPKRGGINFQYRVLDEMKKKVGEGR